MSELSFQIIAKTSKGRRKPALLMLEDGFALPGLSCGAEGEVFGEICFNTSLVGYFEVITDPSYAGQIVALTYPQIGNYGVAADDAQAAAPALRGLVVRDICERPSNWRSTAPLPDYLRGHGVVCIEGVDTRALVRHVRDCGAMRAAISTIDTDEASLLEKVRLSPSIVGQDLVGGVTCKSPHEFKLKDTSKGFAWTEIPPARKRVCVYDCGIKRGILEELSRAGAEAIVFPYDADAQDVLDARPDGVFISNGPGDPKAVNKTYTQVEKLLGQVPVFGICLGHQMMSLAAGAEIEKLKFGHHGGNHPVGNLLSGIVEITAQNHGFGLVFESLGPIIPDLSGGYADHTADLRQWWQRHVAPIVQNDRFGKIQLTHVNLNDGTPEGIRFLDIDAFSVQYHPEANPGPSDSRYLFSAFMKLMDGRSDYLDTDISKDRLSGWKF